LSDSGTISEEADILSLKALNLRESHERPEAMEEAVVPMVGYNTNRILQALEILDDKRSKQINVRDYQNTNVSEKVVKIILSYVDFVNLNSYKKGLIE
jgi:UDP-N-acetylglucosamine 2-epimerase (non-hydrolysing)